MVVAESGGPQQGWRNSSRTGGRAELRKSEEAVYCAVACHKKRRLTSHLLAQLGIR